MYHGVIIHEMMHALGKDPIGIIKIAEYYITSQSLLGVEYQYTRLRDIAVELYKEKESTFSIFRVKSFFERH